MVDETRFTPHAQPGWEAWNSYSPEVEFCRFVGMLQRMMQPAVIVETGVGAGKITAELALDGVEWLGFESDSQWRPAAAQPGVSPDATHIGRADLVILDSDPQWRFDEIACWTGHGKPGSVCVVHDAGNGHPDGWTTHHRVRDAVTRTGQPGVFLRNPRGGWLGIHR